MRELTHFVRARAISLTLINYSKELAARTAVRAYKPDLCTRESAQRKRGGCCSPEGGCQGGQGA